VRCALWRSAALKLSFAPRNGMQLLVRGRVSVYEPRGEYQLIVEYAEEAGEGALRRRFEELKARCARRGCSTRPSSAPCRAAAPDRRHHLALRRGDPRHPAHPPRRFPAVPVVIYPVPVQGEGAAAKIAAALALAARRAECDVLILARGGGSLEDLWSFNEEVVARAIRASAIPVISGVGHEVDFTIADFAADRRAPTPSGAAEIAVPDAAEWLARLNKDAGRLRNAIAAPQPQGRAAGLAARRLAVAHPGNRLRQHGQRLDELELRLRAVGPACAGASGSAGPRSRRTPGPRLRAAGERLATWSTGRHAMRHRLEALHARAGSAARTLSARWRRWIAATRSRRARPTARSCARRTRSRRATGSRCGSPGHAGRAGRSTGATGPPEPYCSAGAGFARRRAIA
jgi:exodeoxyribonuclease VII large subunit